MASKKIEPVQHGNFLGIEIDERLNFCDHLNKISNSVSRKIGMLTQVKKFVNEHTLKTIYFTLLQPQFLYGITVWGGTHSKGLTRLNKLQKKAIRIVTKSKKMDHSEPRLKKLGILKLDDLYKVQSVCMVFDCMKKSTPYYFQNLFYFIENSHRATRSVVSHPRNICLSRLRQKGPITSSSFFTLAVKHWNELPDNFKLIPTKKVFRKHVKEHYLKEYKSKIACQNTLCGDINNCVHVPR